MEQHRFGEVEQRLASDDELYQLFLTVTEVLSISTQVTIRKARPSNSIASLCLQVHLRRNGSPSRIEQTKVTRCRQHGRAENLPANAAGMVREQTVDAHGSPCRVLRR